jgi:hypothetical protein
VGNTVRVRVPPFAPLIYVLSRTSKTNFFEIERNFGQVAQSKARRPERKASAIEKNQRKRPRDDPASIPIAVLELIATAPHQRLLPVDIPVLVTFLQARPGTELAAWQKFDSYWESVNMGAREAEVDKLYFNQGRDGGAA